MGEVGVRCARIVKVRYVGEGEIDFWEKYSLIILPEGWFNGYVMV